jgi:HK97 family phage major capsid protein
MRTGQWFKADLINDNTSGGQYAVPQFFDYDYILLPVLGNELAPLCHIIDVPRGSAAANFTILNPSFAAANTEGSAVSAFDATAMVANHTTTFYRAAGFILLGLNFLSDAVPGLADEVLSRYGAKAAEWLDNMVAVGDGTTQPQGIMVASGTVNITLNTPTTGPYVLSDISRLLFGVPKQYRNNYPKEQAAFGMTDTAYGKIRAIATGVTGDTRLIFGMDLESYKLFDHHAGILSGSSIGSVTMTNDDLFFCQLGGYRLYRRQGVRFYRETAGKTLRLANEMLIGADMRYGGQLDRGSYAAVATSGIP